MDERDCLAEEWKRNATMIYCICFQKNGIQDCLMNNYQEITTITMKALAAVGSCDSFRMQDECKMNARSIQEAGRKNGNLKTKSDGR